MEELDYEKNKEKKSGNGKTIFWSVLLTTLIVGAACVLATYYLHPDYNSDPGDSEPVSSAPITNSPPRENIYRVECLPDQQPTEAECVAKGCLYGETTVEGVPWCHFPEGYGAYRMVGEPDEREWGWQVRLQRLEDRPSQFGGDIDGVILAVEYQTAHRLHFKVGNHQR